MVKFVPLLLVAMAASFGFAVEPEFAMPDTSGIATGVTALLVTAGALVLAWRGIHLFRRGAGQIR
jgi:hypothetical protein